MKKLILMTMILFGIVSCQDEPITPTNPQPTPTLIQGDWTYQKDVWVNYDNGTAVSEQTFPAVGTAIYNFSAGGGVYLNSSHVGTYTETSVTLTLGMVKTYTITTLTSNLLVIEEYPNGEFPGGVTNGTNVKKYFIK